MFISPFLQNSYNLLVKLFVKVCFDQTFLVSLVKLCNLLVKLFVKVSFGEALLSHF